MTSKPRIGVVPRVRTKKWPLPSEHLGLTIRHQGLRDLARSPEIETAIRADTRPLSLDMSRRGDLRHLNALEYWLSGYADFRALAALPEIANAAAGRPLRHLDFDGWHGLVLRHAVLAGWRSSVTTTDRTAHAWLQESFGAEIQPILTSYDRGLPLESGRFDVVMAYNFFCFEREDEMFWLLELRRLLAPGGLLAIRFLDETSFASLCCDPEFHASLPEAARATLAFDARFDCRFDAYRLPSARGYAPWYRFLNREVAKSQWERIYARASFLRNDTSPYALAVLAK